jgi:hypothetical protein
MSRQAAAGDAPVLIHLPSAVACAVRRLLIRRRSAATVKSEAGVSVCQACMGELRARLRRSVITAPTNPSTTFSRPPPHANAASACSGSQGRIRKRNVTNGTHAVRVRVERRVSLALRTQQSTAEPCRIGGCLPLRCVPADASDALHGCPRRRHCRTCLLPVVVVVSCYY